VCHVVLRRAPRGRVCHVMCVDSARGRAAVRGL